MDASQPFTPPLILRAASRPRLARLGDALLTLLLWAGWLYLLLAAIGTLWVPPFVQFLLPVAPPAHPWDVLRSTLLCVTVAVILCALMLLRVLLERRRLAREDRRRRFPHPDDATIARDFGVDAAELPRWRAARRLVVLHDVDGRVVRVCDASPTRLQA